MRALLLTLILLGTCQVAKFYPWGFGSPSSWTYVSCHEHAVRHGYCPRFNTWTLV